MLQAEHLKDVGKLKSMSNQVLSDADSSDLLNPKPTHTDDLTKSQNGKEGGPESDQQFEVFDLNKNNDETEVKAVEDSNKSIQEMKVNGDCPDNTLKDGKTDTVKKAAEVTEDEQDSKKRRKEEKKMLRQQGKEKRRQERKKRREEIRQKKEEAKQKEREVKKRLRQESRNNKKDKSVQQDMTLKSNAPSEKLTAPGSSGSSSHDLSNPTDNGDSNPIVTPEESVGDFLKKQPSMVKINSSDDDTSSIDGSKKSEDELKLDKSSSSTESESSDTEDKKVSKKKKHHHKKHHHKKSSSSSESSGTDEEEAPKKKKKKRHHKRPRSSSSSTSEDESPPQKSVKRNRQVYAGRNYLYDKESEGGVSVSITCAMS